MPPQTSLLGGLKFHGSEQPINQRTSYSVFGEKTVEFSDYFEVDFNLSLHPTTEIGYIIRIKNKESNRIYNLFYDGQGENLTFRFNEEGANNLIVANLAKEELLNLHWFKMKISFDLKSDSIKLTIHNRTFGAGNQELPDTYAPTILFGKSDHIIDVPSFAIKDLSVGKEDKYFFALKESEGTVVHDARGKAFGKVSNPEWLMNDAYHWRYKVSFKSQSVAGANYNPEKKEIYYFNRDSLWIYNVRSGENTLEVLKEPSPVDLVLGTNFIDTSRNKLYTYEVYYEAAHSGPTVASLDLDSYQWTAESNDQLPTQLHHHGSFFDQATNQYTIFGGFGHMRYSKNFFSYDVDTNAWNVLEGFTGDPISPRYFSAVGHLKKTNAVYIFGGMGNESGEQTVGRKYYYDLYRIDLDTKHITKVWEIPWKNDNVVPVRGMVILNDSSFYTLCYPEHFSQSLLKLYRFSLKDGTYEILGDSIPIRSDKITTNANLYYDDGLDNLYAVVQEFDDDISSNLKIYSLAFPPITAAELISYAGNKRDNSLLWILLAFTFTAGAGYLLFRRLRPKHVSDPYIRDIKDDEPISIAGGSVEKVIMPSSVYLFGDFTVRDRKNRDITYMFSAQLRQVFCLILQYSADGGITSQRLSHILWPDRPAHKAKNSRGVTINHLRKALGELDGIELVYIKGYFRFVHTENFYCDYIRCLQIVSSNQVETAREEFIEILTRGKFLHLFDHPLSDSFKEEMEKRLEPVLLLEMEKCFAAELYTTTIDLATALFNIDPLNDMALSYQIRSMQRLRMNEEARTRYHVFINEYRNIMGNDFPTSFKDLS